MKFWKARIRPNAPGRHEKRRDARSEKVRAAETESHRRVGSALLSAGPKSSRHGLGPLLLRQADRRRRRGDHRDWASAWRSRAGRCRANPFAKTTARTDSSGNAAFEFVLPESWPSRGREPTKPRSLLTVAVHDSAGQKESASLSRIVTDEPIHIEVIPEGGTLIQDTPNRVYFLTTYADGRPAATRINVSGFHEELKTNELGAAMLEFAPDGEIGRVAGPGRRRRGANRPPRCQVRMPAPAG